MKILAAATAAILLSGAAVADDPTVLVPARGSYRMTAGEFKDYAYTYELSNGRSVQFSRQFGRFQVALDGEKSDQMYPVAQGVLLTAAGARIEFSEDGSAVTIRNFERLPMAVAMQARNVTVASR